MSAATREVPASLCGDDGQVTERGITALHEAAHALLFELTDVPWRYATLRPRGDAPGHVVPRIGAKVNLAALTLARAAGPAADLVYTGEARSSDAPSDDFKAIDTFLDHLNEKHAATYTTLDVLEAAQEHLLENEDALLLLAEVLHRDGVLYRSDARAALAALSGGEDR